MGHGLGLEGSWVAVHLAESSCSYFSRRLVARSAGPPIGLLQRYTKSPDAYGTFPSGQPPNKKPVKP